MSQKFFIIIIAILMVACSDADRSLDGYWVEQSGKAVAEFKDNKLIISMLYYDQDRYVIGYDKVDDSRYHLKGNGLGSSSFLIVDRKNKSFSMPYVFDNKRELSFKRVVNATASDFKGTWYNYEKGNGNETSIIVTQKESSYDYDYLYINHHRKTYSHHVDKDIKFTFEHGFIFKDIDQTYTYYLTSHDQNTMSFTDSSGEKWSQHRKDNAVHIAIPQGYSKEKEY